MVIVVGKVADVGVVDAGEQGEDIDNPGPAFQKTPGAVTRTTHNNPGGDGYTLDRRIGYQARLQVPSRRICCAYSESLAAFFPRGRYFA